MGDEEVQSVCLLISSHRLELSCLSQSVAGVMLAMYGIELCFLTLRVYLYKCRP